MTLETRSSCKFLKLSPVNRKWSWFSDVVVYTDLELIASLYTYTTAISFNHGIKWDLIFDCSFANPRSSARVKKIFTAKICLRVNLGWVIDQSRKVKILFYIFPYFFRVIRMRQARDMDKRENNKNLSKSDYFIQQTWRSWSKTQLQEKTPKL